MKFFVIALVLLVAFSMEKKLKVQSKAKALKAWYLNIPIYLESFHGYALNIDDNYKLEIIGGKDLSWRIKPVKNDKFYIISSNGSYLCTKTIFNTPQVCRKASDDAQWELNTSGTKKFGLKNRNGKYLRANKYGTITSLATYHVMQDWETWTAIKA